MHAIFVGELVRKRETVVKMATLLARMYLRLSSSNFMLIPASHRLATRNLLTSNVRREARSDDENSIEKNPFYEKYAGRIKELQR